MSGYDDLLRPPLVARDLARAVVHPGGLWREVRVVEETGSTNADAAAAARAGEGEGLVLAAEYQHRGRGRLDRGWEAPPRSALTFSMLLRPPVPTGRWTWLPLLAGVAVVEAVHGATELPAQLKWPNDVLVADRKLAGILVERVEGDAGPAAVVGIGLNVSGRSDELPAGATSLGLAGVAEPDRTVLLRSVLRVVEITYAAWCATGGDAAAGLAGLYRSRCVTLGRQVRIEVAGRPTVVGTATTVDDDGRLVVATSAGSVAVAAGDARHLR